MPFAAAREHRFIDLLLESTLNGFRPRSGLTPSRTSTCASFAARRTPCRFSTQAMHATAVRAPKRMRSTTLASGLSRSAFPVRQAAPGAVTSRAPVGEATAYAGGILELMQESVIEPV